MVKKELVSTCVILSVDQIEYLRKEAYKNRMTKSKFVRQILEEKMK